MKKSIPVPALVVSIVVALALAIFFVSRSGATQEFAPVTPPGKVFPPQAWNAMSPEMQAKYKAEGYTVGEVQAPASANGGKVPR